MSGLPTSWFARTRTAACGATPCHGASRYAASRLRSRRSYTATGGGCLTAGRRSSFGATNFLSANTFLVCGCPRSARRSFARGSSLLLISLFDVAGLSFLFLSVFVLIQLLLILSKLRQRQPPTIVYLMQGVYYFLGQGLSPLRPPIWAYILLINQELVDLLLEFHFRFD